ncbi:hypothetical protein [Paraburkholderia dinghuensis]|uniref:Lipoprotein n=1 Tax=Paraburkholderia dinghuensis TaxID=2305225 RepID=A0A3N6PZ53_9BURK|nr:hypothetical protein [Paraburkholderia dinghuensis]RQH07750.1 hypothetical protein D1Y85_06440 [Paraburkholderia dinghuensis]
MNTRKACFAGLMAVAALLAGCAAQYRNTSACEQEMRRRLVDASQGELSVTNRTAAYRGSRVVVEGHLDKTPDAAKVAATATDTATATAKPKPATPVDAVAQKLGIKKPERTPAAAECTFDEAALKSFRWLAPAALAKTTPEPGASTN